MAVQMKFRLSEVEIDLLRHTLGANSMPQPIHWGWRNELLPATDEDLALAERLCGMGLLGRDPLRPDLMAFYATRAGCLAIGMIESRIEVALQVGSA